MEAYDLGEENIENSLEWMLTEEEFNVLNSTEILNQINSECNLVIDDFEAEVVQGNDLEKAFKAICLVYEHTPNSILEKLKIFIQTALDKKAFIAFDF
jgi:hypothetical protein